MSNATLTKAQALKAHKANSKTPKPKLETKEIIMNTEQQAPELTTGDILIVDNQEEQEDDILTATRLELASTRHELETLRQAYEALQASVNKPKRKYTRKDPNAAMEPKEPNINKAWVGRRSPIDEKAMSLGWPSRKIFGYCVNSPSLDSIPSFEDFVKSGQLDRDEFLMVLGRLHGMKAEEVPPKFLEVFQSQNEA